MFKRPWMLSATFLFLVSGASAYAAPVAAVTTNIPAATTPVASPASWEMVVTAL